MGIVAIAIIGALIAQPRAVYHMSVNCGTLGTYAIEAGSIAPISEAGMHSARLLNGGFIKYPASCVVMTVNRDLR